jgi:hypothetical protein
MITRNKRSYVGEMIGGPMHGITFRHDAPVYRLALNSAARVDDAKAPGVKILGEYRFEVENGMPGAGIWQWKTLIGQQA